MAISKVLLVLLLLLAIVRYSDGSDTPSSERKTSTHTYQRRGRGKKHEIPHGATVISVHRSNSTGKPRKVGGKWVKVLTYKNKTRRARRNTLTPKIIRRKVQKASKVEHNKKPRKSTKQVKNKRTIKRIRKIPKIWRRRRTIRWRLDRKKKQIRKLKLRRRAKSKWAKLRAKAKAKKWDRQKRLLKYGKFHAKHALKNYKRELLKKKLGAAERIKLLYVFETRLRQRHLNELDQVKLRAYKDAIKNRKPKKQKTLIAKFIAKQKRKRRAIEKKFRRIAIKKLKQVKRSAKASLRTFLKVMAKMPPRKWRKVVKAIHHRNQKQLKRLVFKPMNLHSRGSFFLLPSFATLANHLNVPGNNGKRKKKLPKKALELKKLAALAAFVEVLAGMPRKQRKKVEKAIRTQNKKAFKNLILLPMNELGEGSFFNLPNFATLASELKAPSSPVIPIVGKRHLAYTATYPRSCPCILGNSFHNGICYSFTNKDTGKCSKRKCKPSYMCVVGGKTKLTCMRKKNKMKVVPDGVGKCKTIKKTSYTYVPYA